MKWFTVLFSLFILTIVLLADLGMLPGLLHSIYDFPSGDKAGHLILFGLLNYFVTSTVLRSQLNRTPGKLAVTTGLILGLLIAIEESSQKYFSTHTSNVVDLIASILGVIIGGGGALLWHKKRPS